jgi:hypothetical protein
MHALTVLHKKLKQACPSIHKKRLTTLTLAIQAFLLGQRLSLTQLGRCLASKARVKHNIKRIDRLLGNPHLYQERHAIYGFICGELLKGNSRPLIIVDWSDLTTERDFHLLRASIPVGGRTLMLYEEAHPQKDTANPHIHKRFLRGLQRLLPDGCQPIVITDAGFRNTWFKQVRALGWHYVGRVRNRDMLKPTCKSAWKHCKALYRKATFQARYLGEYTVVRSNPIKTHLYLINRKPKDDIVTIRMAAAPHGDKARKWPTAKKSPG